MMSQAAFARIFSDGAVLQRGKKINVWGFAEAGTALSVRLGDKVCNCRADADGRFDASFPPMEKGGPYVLCV
ncbi:MAG: sialate O-acetylesterase, partial [Lachnospiraceae bacterium]|nr:sialate O-acetylesterase [Lachnospiraceae bacterium]